MKHLIALACVLLGSCSQSPAVQPDPAAQSSVATPAESAELVALRAENEKLRANADRQAKIAAGARAAAEATETERVQAKLQALMDQYESEWANRMKTIVERFDDFAKRTDWENKITLFSVARDPKELERYRAAVAEVTAGRAIMLDDDFDGEGSLRLLPDTRLSVFQVLDEYRFLSGNIAANALWMDFKTELIEKPRNSTAGEGTITVSGFVFHDGSVTFETAGGSERTVPAMVRVPIERLAALGRDVYDKGGRPLFTGSAPADQRSADSAGQQ